MSVPVPHHYRNLPSQHSNESAREAHGNNARKFEKYVLPPGTSASVTASSRASLARPAPSAHCRSTQRSATTSSRGQHGPQQLQGHSHPRPCSHLHRRQDGRDILREVQRGRSSCLAVDHIDKLSSSEPRGVVLRHPSDATNNPREQFACGPNGKKARSDCTHRTDRVDRANKAKLRKPAALGPPVPAVATSLSHHPPPYSRDEGTLKDGFSAKHHGRPIGVRQSCREPWAERPRSSQAAYRVPSHLDETINAAVTPMPTTSLEPTNCVHRSFTARPETSLRHAVPQSRSAEAAPHVSLHLEAHPPSLTESLQKFLMGGSVCAEELAATPSPIMSPEQSGSAPSTAPARVDLVQAAPRISLHLENLLPSLMTSLRMFVSKENSGGDVAVTSVPPATLEPLDLALSWSPACPGAATPSPGTPSSRVSFCPDQHPPPPYELLWEYPCTEPAHVVHPSAPFVPATKPRPPRSGSVRLDVLSPPPSASRPNPQVPACVPTQPFIDRRRHQIRAPARSRSQAYSAPSSAARPSGDDRSRVLSADERGTRRWLPRFLSSGNTLWFTAGRNRA